MIYGAESQFSQRRLSSDNTPYEKIGNNDPVSIADEVPFEIPDTWEWVRCASLGEIVRGSGIKRTETVADGLPCVRYGELYTTYNTSFAKTKSFITVELDVKCKHFGYGDILMTLTGENKPDIAKAVAYLGNAPVAAGGDLAYWTCHRMNPLYLVYALSCPYAISRKVHLATGDIIVHISGDKIGSILLPIPPLEEQARIVARIAEIETLLSKYDATEQQLSSLQSTFQINSKSLFCKWRCRESSSPRILLTSLPVHFWSGSVRKSSDWSKKEKSRRTSTNPSFSEGIILIMRSWAELNGVSTARYRLIFRIIGVGHD